MFVDTSNVRGPNGKTYFRALLRSSYREDGKIKHRTLGNLSSCTPEEIEAVRLALRHKSELSDFLTHPNQAPVSQEAPAPNPSASFTQGPSVGAIAVLAAIAEQIGITKALGSDRAGLLALWQVIARAIDQGSRLSSVRLARDLGASSILGLPSFDEDDLYENLAWIEKQQLHIESTLFQDRHANGEQPSLFLYDVTSTYLEGQHNTLAAFGYNRDGKRGKKQIVVGLLCDENGIPIAIEAFPGNTGDTLTVANQITKLQERFNAQHITLVGDRGMIRGPQIKDLQEVGFHYISAISRPQMETMLTKGTLQMELFENELAEIFVPAPADGSIPAERYILRRNPVRQAEIQASRNDRQAVLQRDIDRRNTYLAEHPRAKESTATKQLEKRLITLRLATHLTIHIAERHITLVQDDSALAELSKLDGCYALRTDLTPAQADKHLVHARYKSLAHVEQAFRRSKTVELEMRPVHVRTESSTRGHLMVVMLAYQLMQELGKRWANLDLTVAEGLTRLNTYCAVKVAGTIQLLLEPRADVQELLTAACVTLPTVLPKTNTRVSTKKKLQKSRSTRLK